MPPLESYRPQIEAALRYADGSHTFDDVAQMIESGRLQCWPGPRSIVVTEVLEYPRYRALNFFLPTGQDTR